MLAPLHDGLLLNSLGTDPILVTAGEGRPVIKAWTETNVTCPGVLQHSPIVRMPVSVRDPGVQEQIAREDIECGPVGVTGALRTLQPL